MRTIAGLVLGIPCLAALATAQAKPSPEAGTAVGVTVLSQSGSSVTRFGIPGGGILTSPTLYLTLFPSPSSMVEPQLAFTHVSGGGSGATLIDVAVQIGHLFEPSRKGSAYVALNAAFQSYSGGGGTAAPGLGAAVGYRAKIKTSLAARFEARYRRWFSDLKDLNEFGFAVGLGAIL